MANMYQVEKDTAFYASLKTLRFFFVYLESKENSTFSVASYISFILSTMVFVIFIFGSSIHMVMSIKANDGGDISEDLSVILGGLGMMTNVGMFQHHQSRWSKFFSDVTNFKKFGKPTDFDSTRDRGNLLAAGYVVYCTIGSVVYSFVAILESSCEQQEGGGSREICGTLTPVWLPFGEVSLVAKDVIFLVQYCLANYIITSSAVCCFLPFETAELLISHIGYLKENFLRVFQVDHERTRMKKLRFCIRYHIFILGMADQLNFLVKFTLGHMSLICAMVFGCIGNQIFRAKPLGAAIFLLGYMVSLFLLCYAGQRVINESLSVVDVIYESAWYEGSIEMKKSLKFVMARCQIPSRLSAWPFGFFSFPLFLMIVRTSYSYLTLLRQST